MTSDTTQPVERACLAVAAALVAVGVLHLGVFVVDDRPWSGPVSWRKPFTFGEAFGVTLATVVWVSRPLRMSARWRSRLLAVLAVDCIVEVGGVTLQAWRGVPSHLNRSTPVDAAVAGVLAAGGAVLIVTLGSFAAIAAVRTVAGTPDRALAVRAGWLFLVAGLASGVAMIAVGTVAMNSGDTERAYEVTGFLKAFHGLTIHALLTLPALAWLLDRLSLPPRTRTTVVAASVAVLAATAVVLLVTEIAAL